jgi:formate hydrogenlyase subunit 3/multisubunit Na+/H+ antiporter MnhD subunit
MSIPEAQPGLLLALIPLLPLAGAITLWCGTWCGLRTPGRSIALLAAGLSLLTIVAAVVSLGAGEAPRTLTGGRWLVLRGGAAGAINLSLRWDGLAALWLLVQSAAALLVLCCSRRGAQSALGARSTAAWSLSLLGLVDLLALAGNYWQLFVCWELSLVAAWRLLASVAADEAEERAAERVLWTGLIGDLPLLIGLLAIWQSFGTFEFAAVLQPVAAAPVPPESPPDVMRGFATFCLIIAALVRCAQFPVCNWLPRAAGMRGAAAQWGTLIGIVATGVFLLLRSVPLLATNAAALSLLVNWGCLSAAVWGCLVLTQPDWRRALASFVTGMLGLACAGIGMAGRWGVESAIFLASNLIVLSAALLCCRHLAENGNRRAAHGPGRRGAVCLAIALASGVWGQEAVLFELWESGDVVAGTQHRPPADAVGDAARPAAVHGTSPAAPLAAVFAHLLLSLGLLRALFRSETASIQIGSDASGESRLGGYGVAVIVLSAALFVPLLISLRPPLPGWQVVDGRGVTDVILRLCTPGITGLLMLLALLLAWFLSRASRDAGARLERSFSSLVRLSRRGFYVDEAFWICCGLPLSICANVCRFLEQYVWERELISADDGISPAPDADTDAVVAGRSLVPVLALFVAAGAVLVILLLEG